MKPISEWSDRQQGALIWAIFAVIIGAPTIFNLLGL